MLRTERLHATRVAPRDLGRDDEGPRDRAIQRLDEAAPSPCSNLDDEPSVHERLQVVVHTLARLTELACGGRSGGRLMQQIEQCDAGRVAERHERTGLAQLRDPGLRPSRGCSTH